MKKRLLKISLGFLATILSVNAWSQCPVVNCPADIIVSTDSTGCGTIVSYTAPTGSDSCGTFIDTIFYTGALDYWIVPAGVGNITITAIGAEGSNNTSSTVSAGLGARMSGDFTVTPGDSLVILVGQQYHDIGGNGGGGGTFVVDSLNVPLVIAGGGGGSGAAVDSTAKHGQVGTVGGVGAGGGGLGGTAGNGGEIGSVFASGAGGGLLTNGADGWTPGSGGFAFVNGGAGANTGYGIGGFGGGGNGSGNVVGGGGGGYSGGGGSSNILGGGVGGGGGSLNNGTNQINAGGVNNGHGMVIISYGGATTTTFEAGIGSGGTFPVGTSIEEFSVVNAAGDSAFCSFNVIVYDSIIPTVVAPLDVTTCNPVVTGAFASTSDNCLGEVLSYNLTGSTTGAGSGDVNGMTFNIGTTTVWYIVTDASGNQDSTSFNVLVNPLPIVGLDAFVDNTLCINHSAVTLPAGTPAGGVYSGPGVASGTFDPAIAGVGTHFVVYTFTDTTGCSSSDSTSVIVDGCAGVDENTLVTGFNVYPNPSNGLYTVEFDNESLEQFQIEITDVNGRKVYSSVVETELVKEVIDLREESNGVYFMEVNSETKSTVVRLIRQ